MNLFTQLSLVAVTLCATATSAFAAIGHHSYDPVNYALKGRSSSVFADERSKNIDRINARMYGGNQRARSKSVKPDEVYGPSSILGDLDAPNGETWFYNAKLTYDTIPPDYEAGIWFAELILRAYDFTIYNSKMEIIGHIKDKMRYEDDEVRVPYIDLAPVVTQKFFNTDDYYEVIVGVAANPTGAGVREHSFIYSLNKPDNTDADGNDIPVASLGSFIGDVLTISDKTDSERYIITTSAESSYGGSLSDEDYEYDGDPADSPYWKSLLSQKMTVKVLTNAVNDTDGPLEIGSKTIPLTQLQGDQMNAPIVLTTLYDGKPYVAFAQYKDTFYNPYSSPWAEDVSMREKNSLMVEIYSQSAPDSRLELFQETEIKFTKDSSVDRLLASYYSIGSMRFRNDLDFDPAHYNNTSGKAYLTVTKENYIAGSDDSYINSYYIYKNTGVRYKTIFTDAQSTMSLSNIEGFEPQQVFITYSTGYVFHFVNLLSVKEVLNLSNSYVIDEDQEPELLLANMDRTPVDDSYNYVFELRIPTVDENENDNIRAIWINADGSFNRIDEVNMGTNVLYAKMYINSSVLHPGVYSNSPDMAYMCLIKRGTGGTAVQEELLIADAKSEDNPEGKSLLLCKPNGYGNISTVMPLFANNMPRLWVVYVDPATYLLTLEVYKLPLVETDDKEDDSISEISRPDLSADTVYDLQGRRVAKPLRGLYIINGRKILK